jgi:hypothetical protein
MNGTDLLLSTAGIVAFVGPFGTGKTEVAISYSLASLRAGRATSLVDFDVVTPYFRVGDCRQRLEARGLRVIAAEGPLASFENPALSPAIAGALLDQGAHVVLDAGGDLVGARLLSAYEPQIRARQHELWLVVNPYRPGSSVDTIEAHRRAIEDETQLSISALVANPHLGPLTEPSHIEHGLKLVQQASDSARLPIAFLAVADHLLAALPDLPVAALPLRRFLRLPWEQIGAQEESVR